MRARPDPVEPGSFGAVRRPDVEPEEVEPEDAEPEEPAAAGPALVVVTRGLLYGRATRLSGWVAHLVIVAGLSEVRRDEIPPKPGYEIVCFGL
jgi:hypothetical protein